MRERTTGSDDDKPFLESVPLLLLVFLAATLVVEAVAVLRRAWPSPAAAYGQRVAELPGAG